MPGKTIYSTSHRYNPGMDHSFELETGNLQDPVPAFHFRKRYGEIDWRKLSSIDVDRVARELDFVTLQENISVVTFCNIDAVSDLDPLFSKLFKLSQYTIEYLLHSQEYLQSVVGDLEGKLETAAKEYEDLQHKMEESGETIEKLKLENKRRRKMIQQQQMVIESGASSYYQCPHCEKAFMNASFLQGHMQRRHPESVHYIGDVIAHSQREQTKLGDHLKQLEGDLADERETFNKKLKEAEEDKKRWAEQSRRDMDEWKAAEEAKWKEEFETLRTSFMGDISKLKDKEKTYQKTIGDLQNTMQEKSSNLGELVDDVQEEKQKLRDYEDRVQHLEKLTAHKNEQISALTDAMKRLKQDQRLTKEEKERLMRSQKMQFDEIKEQMKRSQTQDKAKMLASRKPKPKPRPDPMEYEMDGGYAGPSTEERNEMVQNAKKRLRSVVEDLLTDKLRDCGVDPSKQGIPTSMLTNKLLVLKTQRQQKAKEVPNLYKLREEQRRKVEQAAKKRFSEKFPQGSRKKRPAASTLPKQRLSHSMHAQVRSAAPGGSPSARSAPGPAAKSRKAASERRHRPSSVTQQRTPVASHATKHAASPAASPRQRQQEDLDDLRSPWDSEEDTEDDDVSPKTTPPTGGERAATGDHDDWDDDIDDILALDDLDAKPQGRVKEIGAKLEQQFSSRKRPPAGAVDVTTKQATQVEKFVASDDDEEDSFLVSSLEDNENKPSPVPRGSKATTSGVRQSGASTSTSVWGSGNRPLGQATKDDEISDFDDSELDELLT